MFIYAMMAAPVARFFGATPNETNGVSGLRDAKTNNMGQPSQSEPIQIRMSLCEMCQERKQQDDENAKMSVEVNEEHQEHHEAAVDDERPSKLKREKRSKMTLRPRKIVVMVVPPAKRHRVV